MFIDFRCFISSGLYGSCLRLLLLFVCLLWCIELCCSLSLCLDLYCVCFHFLLVRLVFVGFCYVVCRLRWCLWVGWLLDCLFCLCLLLIGLFVLL